jgi:hypothetical protein
MTGCRQGTETEPEVNTEQKPDTELNLNKKELEPLSAKSREKGA